MDEFETALMCVLDEEGGFADNKKDRGGATNQGVSLRAASQWWEDGKLPFAFSTHGAGPVSVEDIRIVHKHPDVRDRFYRKEYWDRVQGDLVVLPIAYSLFDFAVNSGPVGAILKVQEELSVPRDGVMGPNTREAMRRQGVMGSCVMIAKARLRKIQGILDADPSQWGFEKGWRERALRVLFRCGGFNEEQGVSPR